MTDNKYGTLNAEAIIQYDQGRPATPHTDDIYYLLRSIADKPHLAPITIQHFVESVRRDATGELRLPITRSEYESNRREVWTVVLVDQNAVNKEVARDVWAVEALGIPWKDQPVETMKDVVERVVATAIYKKDKASRGLMTATPEMWARHMFYLRFMPTILDEATNEQIEQFLAELENADVD